MKKIPIASGLIRLGFKSGVDFECWDTGQGPFIKEWKSDKPKPDLEVIKSAAIEYQKDYNNLAYQRKRQPEYPSIEEQLDMIYHDIDAWREKIKSIKDKYPKPGL